MQNWGQWQVPPAGTAAGPMPQPPAAPGYPATGTDPMATMQAYMQYYNQPAPSGYTTEQWAAAQQQNWAQWQQWQQQYQQWQAQYGAKYQESMKQMSSMTSGLQPPPLPKEDFSTKPPLPPENMNQNLGMPPPTQNNFPFAFKPNVNPPLPPGQPPPPPENPPPSDNDLTGIKRSANDHLNTSSAKKTKSEDDELTDAERTFDAQFKQWEEQFNKWKLQNADHPDKAQYKQYEAKWTSWREKLIERREQMRKKREAQKAKVEAEKKKTLPGGDKLLNILSNTENQGLINNLLGIGKTLGLSGKEASSVSTSQPASASVTASLPVQAPVQPTIPVMSTTMTPEASQQAWAAQQWAQYSMAAMTVPSYTSYPPPVIPPPAPLVAPSSLGYQPMAPPPNPLGNFSQPPPGFPSNNFSQPSSGGSSGNQNAPFKPDDNSNAPFRNDQYNNNNKNNNNNNNNNNSNNNNNNQSYNDRFGSNDSNNRQGQDSMGQFRSNDSFNRDSGPNRFNQDDRSNFSGDRFRRDGQSGRDFGFDNRSNDYRSGDSFGSKDRSNDRNFGDDRFSRDDGNSRDNNRFGGANRDSFNSSSDRGSGSNNREQMDSEDRFGNNQFNDDRFGSDRFNSGSDRRDNFGNSNNRNQGRNSRFDQTPEMSPELKKLMEKRRVAMDIFKPSGTFLGADKSDTNFGSLSESFKKITGDSPFLPRNRSSDFGRNSFSDNNKGSFSDSFNKGSGSFVSNNDSDNRFRDDFRSRGSDFNQRGSDDFNNRFDNTGPRGSNDFGPRGRDFGPRGSDSDFGKDRGFGSMMNRSKTPPRDDARQNDFMKPSPLMEGRQQGMEGRQQGMEGRQQGIEGPQQGMEGRQQGMEGRQQGMEGRQQGMEGRQQGMEGRQQGMEERQSLMGERPPLMGERPPLMGERPPLIGEHPPLMGERPPLMGERPSLMGDRPPLIERRSPQPEDHSMMKKGYSTMTEDQSTMKENQTPSEEKQLSAVNEKENKSEPVISPSNLPPMDIPPWMDSQMIQNRSDDKDHGTVESFSVPEKSNEANNSETKTEVDKNQAARIVEPEKKLDVLPFMGENDPKPEDLNMEPPPELPNLGPVDRPFETKEQGRDFNSNSSDKPFEKREFESRPFSGNEPNSFESKNSDSFGPKGSRKPNTFDSKRSDSFGPRNSDRFGPRGPDGFGPQGSDSFGFKRPDPFGLKGPAPFGRQETDSFEQKGPEPFGPRGSDSFGPRGSDSFGPKGNDSFGPREKDSFGPRGSDSFGPKGNDSFGPRGNDSFGPRGNDLFGPRGNDSFGPRGNDSFGPRGNDSFGPRGNDSFGPRGNDSFGPRGNDSFGPRGNDSFGPKGPDSFGPRGSDMFGPRENDSFGPRGPDSFGPRGFDSFGPKTGFDSFGSSGPGPFGPRGPDSFGPRGPDSFGPRGPDSFGSRFGSDMFGPRGPAPFEQRRTESLDSRGSEGSSFRNLDLFGPKGPDPFGPRDQSDNRFSSSFGPSMNNQRGSSLLGGPGGLNDDPFSARNPNDPFLGPRGPDDSDFRPGNSGPSFSSRTFSDLQFITPSSEKPAPLRGLNEKTFGPNQAADDPPKIPSLLSVKFDPPIGMLKETRDDIKDSHPLDSNRPFDRPFGPNSISGPGPGSQLGPDRDLPMRQNFPMKDFLPRDNNSVSLLGPGPSSGPGPGPFSSSFGPMQGGSNDMQPGFNKPPMDMDNSFSRRMGNQPGVRRDGPMHPSFCIEKQFNYNHGDGAPNEVFKEYKPSKVTDYGHIRRPSNQDYVTPVHCFDYSHGRLKPVVPDHEIYPRLEFQYWQENEHNLKEYNDSFSAYKNRLIRSKMANKRNRREPSPVWKREERKRFSDHYSSWDREDNRRDRDRDRDRERDRDNRGKDHRDDKRVDNWEDRRGESREDRRRNNRDEKRSDRGKRDSFSSGHHSGYSKDSKDYKDNKDSKDHKETRDKKERQPSWEIEIEKLSEETARKNASEAEKAREKLNRNQKDSNTEIKKDEERSKGNVSRQENSLNNIADASNQDSSQDVTNIEPKSPPRTMELAKTSNLTIIDDLLFPPGRQNRPPKIAIILRGPPGSGKSFVAKLIKDKELEQAGSAPRILSLDDYFLTEKEIESTDDNGKKIINKEMVYEYEEGMESSYLTSLVKAFKKNIVDGFFNFIILDSINEKISDYEEMWSFAKSKGFRVYICEMDMDVQICLKRNVHNRTEDEINRIIDYFEPTPNYHQKLDVSSLLQDEAIEQVQMEEVTPLTDKKSTDSNEDSQDSQEGQNPLGVSKWEKMEAEDKLDRLDGLAKRKNDSKPQTMEDFLQVPDYYDSEDSSGKKRVRWADLEERKQQEKLRAVGFVVGQTNWNRMMDPTMGSSALTRTKFYDSKLQHLHN